MKVAMIAPPAWANWAPNPAMLQLSAQLDINRHSVEMFDLNIDAYNHFSENHQTWWEDSNSLKWETKNEVLELFKCYSDFFNNYANAIKNLKPDLIAFTVNSGARYTSRKFSEILRNIVPEIPIIFGGSDCFRSELFNEYMHKGVVDAVCTGEGDLAFPEFVNRLDSEKVIPKDISGFLTWDGDEIIDAGKPVVPSNLDLLQPVKVDDIDFNKYTKHNRMTLMTSRGCINRCAYCSEGPNFGKYRTHSAKWMIKQIKDIIPFLIKSGEPPHINFNDSLINGKVSVLEEFCDLILDEKIKFTWGGMAFIREEMTFELLKKMRRAGCIELCWGLESGSGKVLKLMRKRYTPELADRVLNDTAKADISQYGNIIIGFPGEGPEEFAESLLFLIKNKNLFSNLGLPILTPRKNSALYNKPEKWNLKNLLANDWVTIDEKNTPEIRILRRDILASVLDDKLFDQGRHDEQKNSVELNISSSVILEEYQNIFDAFIKTSSQYLQQEPGLLPLIASTSEKIKDGKSLYIRKKYLTQKVIDSWDGETIPKWGQAFFYLKQKLGNIDLFEELLMKLQSGEKNVKIENMPIELYIEPTVRCNLKCPMCSHELELNEYKEKYGKDKLDFEKNSFDAFLPMLQTASMVYTVGIGEPTLNKDLSAFISMCTKKAVFTWINTNGTTITDEKADEFIKSGISRIVISASGANKKDYEKYHYPAKWNKLWSSINILSESKKYYSMPWPQIFINFVTMDNNIESLPSLTGKLAPYNIDGLTVKPVVNMKGILDINNDAPKYHSFNDKDEQMLQGLRIMAKAAGFNFEDHSLTETHRADKKMGICMHPFSTMYINPNGDVYPCGPGEALCGADLIIGNINKNTTEEIWFSDKAEKLRAQIINRNYLDGCKECISKQLCRLHNDKSEGVEGMIHAAINGSINLDKIKTINNCSPYVKEKFIYSYENLAEIKIKNFWRYVSALHMNNDVAINTPLEIFLESSNACNLNCRFCAMRVKENRPAGPSAIMDDNVIDSVKGYLAGAASVSLHGFGEPLMNKRLIDTACTAAEHRCNVEFFTNGKLLTEEKSKALVTNKVSKITVSISTDVKESYEYIYERGDFDRLIKNLEFLRDEKVRQNSRLPIITFNAIAMRSTVKDLPGLTRLAARLNIEKIEIKPLVTYEGLTDFQDERITFSADKHGSILNEVNTIGKQYGIEISDGAFTSVASDDKNDPAPATGHDWQDSRLALEEPCPLVFRSIYVQANGDVKPCCFASDEKELSLGNVNDTSIEDIWNGPAYRAVRKAHIALKVPKTCSHCVKFNLAPKDDATSWWLGENGIKVFDISSIKRIKRMIKDSNTSLAMVKETFNADSKDLNYFGNLLKTSVVFLKQVSKVNDELSQINAHLSKTADIKQTTNLFVHNLAITAKEAHTFLQKRDLNQAITTLENSFETIEQQWPDISKQITTDITNACTTEMI